MNVTDADMNTLQDNAIISDNCVTWDDVAEVDRPRALEFLESLKTRVPMELL